MKKILFLLALVLILLIGFLALVEFDAPEIGARLLARLGERAGMDLAAEEFRFNLLRGVKIGGVRGSSVGQESEMFLEIEKVTLSHRLLPLLRGSWVFDRIVLDRPVVELRTARPGDLLGAAAVPAALAVPDQQSAATRLTISSIVVRNGRFIGISEGEPEIEIEGLRLTLNNLQFGSDRVPDGGLTGDGKIAAESIRLGDLILRDSSGPLKLDDGKLVLDGHQFTNDLGRFEVDELEIDMDAEPFTYRLVLEGDPLDVASLLGGSGNVEAGKFLLDATGRGPEKEALTGRGRVHLPRGEVPASPYLELIDATIGTARIVGSQWEPVDIDFTIVANRVRLIPFTLMTEHAEIDVEGEIDLDGPLDLKLRVGAPREEVRVEEIPRELIDLLTDEKGRVSIPLAMSGTMENPRLRPDWNELTEIGRGSAGREAGRKFRESLERGLRKLLERD